MTSNNNSAKPEVRDDNIKNDLPGEIEIRNFVSNLRAALREGSSLPNIWTFYSVKNKELLTIQGDLAFVQAVLLEGDTNVSAYKIISQHETSVFGCDFHVRRVVGGDEILSCRRRNSRSEGGSKRTAVRSLNQDLSEKMGAPIRLITDSDLVPHLTRFWNYLTLCSAVTRSRDFDNQKENDLLFSTLKTRGALTVLESIKLPGADEGLMLGVIGKNILSGRLHAETGKEQISAKTLIHNHANWKPGKAENAIVATATTESEIGVINTRILRNVKNIPLKWRCLDSWPTIDPSCIEDEDSFRQRKKSVEMFAQGLTSEEITQETGLKYSWVRKLFKKCLLQHKDGEINGFRALRKYTHLKKYCRTAPTGEGSIGEYTNGGFSGAFTALLEKYPDELLDIFQENVLKFAENLPEESMRMRLELHGKIYTPKFWRFLYQKVLLRKITPSIRQIMHMTL